MHLDPWTLYEYVICPYFQHFLHCETPGFIFALQTIAIKLLTLKHLLIKPFALVLLCIFQMSMSDLEDILIALGREVIKMLLKI